MLTVAVDATPLVGERTGIGKAVSGLLTELAARRDPNVVGFGLTTRGWHRLVRSLPDGVKPARAPMPAGALMRLWSRTEAVSAEWWTGPVDVVHGTNYVVPPTRRAARLMSVWDLTAVRYPELCTPTSRRYPALVARAVQQGAWVHTGAASVAEEIVEHFGADPSKVRVIAPGITRPGTDRHGTDRHGTDRHGTDRPGTDPTGAERRGSADPPGYVLALGTSEPRKDYPGLVSAFDQVASVHGRIELHIAGPEGWAEGQLRAAIARSPYRDRIKRLGYIADTGPLLSGATVFAYPSIYEGFGYPPLEAMANGVPVVATSAGAVPETAGDGALIVPPGDPDAFAKALLQVLDDDELRSRMVENGRRRAETFTWEATATAMTALYSEMADAL